METSLKKSRHCIVATSVAAFVIPFFFAISGIDWSARMHPDEVTILKALRETAEFGCPKVVGSVYPEGYFVLVNIYRKVTSPFKWFSQQFVQEGGTHRDLDVIRSPIPKFHWPTIAMGRRTNAVLAGLCGLFLFLAVRVATGSAIGGLCASVLAACSPFVVEHAHYCETDISFCAGLALALWTLFSAVRRNSFHWIVGGAASCAAAFACKYTVAPLVPFCIIIYLALCVKLWKSATTSVDRRRVTRRCALVAILCILAAIGAYAMLTPLLRKDFAFFWERIFRIYGNVHREVSTRNLSGEGTMRHLLFWSLYHALCGHLLAMGPIHLILASFAAIFLIARARKNPCGPWLLALLALFVAFDLSVAPWIRSQEFLPVAIILNTAAALAAGELCALAHLSRFRIVRYALPALCLAVCCALAYGDALRTARMFTTEDSRNTMRHWLEQSSNPATRFAANRFAYPALRYGRISTSDVFGEAESLWSPSFTANAMPDYEYFVRQTLFLGRGFVDAVTGERTPYRQSGWTNFLARAVLLREWKFIPGYQTTFSMLPMELWGIIPENATFALPTPFAPRATAYRMGPEHYDVAQGGDWLGPIEAIRTVGARKGVRFVPPRDGRPLYAVTRHSEGFVPAKIKWECCFEPREKVIDPGRADWFLYKPGLFDGWGDIYVRTRVRMRGDDQTSLCLTTITADPAYAAELLARGGSPDKAAELLSSAGLPQDVDAAIGTAVKPFPKSFLSDFARIRFGDLTVYPGPESLTNETDACAANVPVRLESEFPVLFDPGTYHITFQVPRRENDDPELKSITFTKAASQRFLSGEELHPGENVEMELVFKKPACPRICGVAISNGEGAAAVTLGDFSIVWKQSP